MKATTLPTLRERWNQIILKLNHFIFAWYYNQVPEHFRSWTFFKSIDLLIQNYNHQKWCKDRQGEFISRVQREYESQVKELNDLKMRNIATESQINWANRTFGTDFTKPSDN